MDLKTKFTRVVQNVTAAAYARAVEAFGPDLLLLADLQHGRCYLIPRPDGLAESVAFDGGFQAKFRCVWGKTPATTQFGAGAVWVVAFERVKGGGKGTIAEGFKATTRAFHNGCPRLFSFVSYQEALSASSTRALAS